MENTITREKIKDLLKPNPLSTSKIANELVQMDRVADVVYAGGLPFEEEHPSRLRLYWLYKACLNTLVQERDLQIEQENLKGAISRIKIIRFLENEKRLSNDMRNTLIKIVKSNDVSGIRAVYEILQALNL